MRVLSCASMKHMMNMTARPELSRNVGELTSDDLRRVNIATQRIYALALIELFSTTSKLRGKQNILGDCLIKCPPLNNNLSNYHFDRTSPNPALIAASAYCLIMTLGDTEGSTRLENTCLETGTRVLGCRHAAAVLFERVCPKGPKQQQTEDK